jgi:ABC-type xylose transport system permease subunit
MGNQSFNGDVGQVAGGNINNYGLDDLTSRSREEVTELLIHLRERLADARKKMIFNPIVGWMVLGALTFLIELFSGIAFASSIVLVTTIFLGILVPYFFFMPIQKKYGRLVYAYRQSIAHVEIFQHSRGWA